MGEALIMCGVIGAGFFIVKSSFDWRPENRDAWEQAPEAARSAWGKLQELPKKLQGGLGAAKQRFDADQERRKQAREGDKKSDERAK